jgi:uncharacterized protein (TIGR03083 family)
MEKARFLECLADDYGRILAVAPGHLDARVPTCPEWDVADLVRHLGAVYLHKVSTMREGRRPVEWPPPGLSDEEPIALLDRAYGELVSELSSRPAEEVSETFYEPDQSVGFWVRRMAQETVIHRIDAELAVGVPVAPIPDDLAVDGIDELLKVFVAYDVEKWPGDYAEVLGASPERSYAISTPGAKWRIVTSPGGFSVQGGPGATAAVDSEIDVTVTGPSSALLRWVWNRSSGDEASDVIVTGDPDAAAEFRRCVVTATQ